MRNFWKSFAAAAVLALTITARAASPFPIGQLTVDNGISWHNPNTNAVTFRIYAGETNTVTMEVVTNKWSGQVYTNVAGAFPIADVATTNWPGYLSTNLNGMKAVYITAISPNTNLESHPSEVVLIDFVAGVPKSPSNIQIYQFLRAAAVNPAPPFQAPQPQRRFQGPEWEPSGR
jgi:hypothetical protein